MRPLYSVGVFALIFIFGGAAVLFVTQLLKALL